MKFERLKVSENYKVLYVYDPITSSISLSQTVKAHDLGRSMYVSSRCTAIESIGKPQVPHYALWLLPRCHMPTYRIETRLDPKIEIGGKVGTREME